MKKATTLMISFFLMTPLFALPVGNPWEASLLLEGFMRPQTCREKRTCWSNRLGFYGDYIFNRKLEVSTSDKTLRETKLYTNAGYLVFNIRDRIDLFTTIGTTHISIKTPVAPFVTSSGSTATCELQTETDFSWSLGVRGSLFELCNFAVGLEAQYFSTRPNLNYFEISMSSVTTYLDGEKLKYEEWQLGFGLAYRFYISCNTAFVPYMAVKWSGVHVNMGNRIFQSSGPEIQLRNLTNQWSMGYALGVTLLGCDLWSINAEGRFVDELALGINGQIRF